MKKRRLSGEMIVLGIFFFSIGFLILFGNEISLTGHTISESEIFEWNIDVEIGDNFYPGDDISFKIVLYDSENNKFDGKVSFEVQNYYTEVIEEGSVNSGQYFSFILPSDAIRGHWAVVVNYDGTLKKELFNVLELEKAEIVLEGDKLIITNIGNVPYRKPIQISIGSNKETALVPLGIGETKEIKLTAPEGNYNIKVSDGTENNDLEFGGVSLTGNVIGLEGLRDKNFFKENPMITMFLVVVGGLVVALLFKMRDRKEAKKKE
jgi:hypothetical protein